MTRSEHTDVVVVGSGFGGSTAALRLRGRRPRPPSASSAQAQEAIVGAAQQATRMAADLQRIVDRV